MKSILLAASLVLVASLPASAANVMAANDIDAKQGDIQERLRDGVESGRLTDAKMHEFKEQLQKLADEEAGYKAKNGELSMSQTMHLHFEVDKISKALEAALTDRKSGAIDVVAESQSISKALDDSLASQKLTQQEYDVFKGNLTAINKRIDEARGADGKLQTNDQVRLALDLDNLRQSFAAGEHQRQADMSEIDKRKDDFRQMIRKGVATGDLTEDEVDDLRQQLYNYDAKEARLTKLGRPLTSDEQLSFALELERFGAEIRARMDNGVNSKITDKTIGYRRAAVDQSIANSLFSGDISIAEARDFKASLDKIALDEKQVRAQSNNELSKDQIEALLIEVEKVKGKFSRLTYNRAPVWVGVDGMVVQIRQKVADAYAAKRLTEEENDVMQSRIADVLVSKSNERNAGGFVTIESALHLAAEITVLSEQVSKKLGDRNVSMAPDIVKRKGEVDRSIASGIILGKLKLTQATNLLGQLEAIGKSTNSDINVNANVSAGAGAETQSANRARIGDAIVLEKLATAVLKAEHENIAANQTAVSLKQMEQDVDNEIAGGTLSGKLSARETQHLRDQLAEITGTRDYQNLSSDSAATVIAIAEKLNKILEETKSTANNGITALPDVDKREAELDKQIVDGLMQGRLTQAEADSLEQELKRIEIVETRYRSAGGFSLGEQASLTLELEKVGHSIEEKLHDVQIAQPDVDVSRSHVDTMLAEAVDDGLLTVADCAPFAQELDNIARGETTYRFSGNGLSYAESLALQAQIDKLVASVDEVIKARKNNGALSVSLDSRITSTASEIAAASTARKIDADVRERLEREISRITEEKKAFATSGGALSLTEVSSVIRDLDRLNANLSGRLGTGRNIVWTDIEGRPLRLEGAINRGLATGRLKPALALKARRELAVFKQIKAQMKAQSRDKSGNLTYPQQITLAQQLDKVVMTLGLPSQRQGAGAWASAPLSNNVSR